MQWRDNQQRYGLVSMLLHWGVALLLLILVWLGLRVTSLGIFDPGLEPAINLHQSLGLLLVVLMLLRLAWRSKSVAPAPLGGNQLQRYVLRKVRLLMYLLVFVAGISGYLLATGASREFAWFGLMQMPVFSKLGMAEIAQLKNLHGLAVWSLCALVVLHVAAALKVQFIDRQAMLQRMLGKR